MAHREFNNRAANGTEAPATSARARAHDSDEEGALEGRGGFDVEYKGPEDWKRARQALGRLIAAGDDVAAASRILDANDAATQTKLLNYQSRMGGNENRYSLLFWATYNGRAGLTELFLQRGANPNLVSMAAKGNTPLHHASASWAGHHNGTPPPEALDDGRAACVRALARTQPGAGHAPCDLNALSGDGKGYTAAHKAAWYRLWRTWLALKEAGADVAGLRNRAGETSTALLRRALDAGKLGVTAEEEAVLRAAIAEAEAQQEQ